jgi:hypothetical protein
MDKIIAAYALSTPLQRMKEDHQAPPESEEPNKKIVNRTYVNMREIQKACPPPVKPFVIGFNKKLE